MQLRDNLKTRLDSMELPELLKLSRQLHVEVKPEDTGLETKWVKIKPNLSDTLQDIDKGYYKQHNVQRLIGNVDKIKVILLNNWYVNEDLGIKLRPEWVEVISVSNEVK